ncbi:hypothetical protein O7627_18005 [Solwaraspora sp. WMMD1047]|uniref:hypothetical protein n=1 Tax=Solwaraspora sp. WMMD1047 TaxID=3016102 RepID=UPI002415EB0B|nr:hypothetical protein [Solwaraspora sp. WMMD1047]MDG4831193.1 hypothetical protein [Solwaraspora sp. WMMD1047]
MSEPEEEREKSPGTDAVLRPPRVGAGPADADPPPGTSRRGGTARRVGAARGTGAGHAGGARRDGAGRRDRSGPPRGRA